MKQDVREVKGLEERCKVRTYYHGDIPTTTTAMSPETHNPMHVTQKEDTNSQMGLTPW